MRIPNEYSVELPVKRGQKNSKDVKLVQEWLTLHGISVRVDGDFGPATEAAVRKFQTKNKLRQLGYVDELTFRALMSPITRVCAVLPTTASDVSARVVAAARVHLREHPREVGGSNMGPWVRLYTKGKQGPDWPWCAAFVTYLINQGKETLKPKPTTIEGSVSCDELARQAKALDKFVAEADIKSGTVDRSVLVPGTIFLVRNPKNAEDWTHTGVVTAFHTEYLDTIEGNTNDAGDREGYEVCKRTRGYKNMDFILV